MTIRVGGLFSGIGAHHSACDRIRAEGREDFEVVFQCELDPKTSEAYDAIHGSTLNLGDVTKVHDIGGDLKVDVLFWTPPCLDADTRVLTSEGWRPIRDISAGDMVMTDDGLRSVTAGGCTGERRVMTVEPRCGLPIRCTPEHRFLARRGRGPVEWIEACLLDESCYVGFPVPSADAVPQWGGADITGKDGSVAHENRLSGVMSEPWFWSLVGYYLASGWVSQGKSKGSVRIELPKVKSGLIVGDLKYSRKEADRRIRYGFYSKEFGEFCSQFGTNGNNKFIPAAYMGIPDEQALIVLDAMAAVAGSSSDGRWSFSTPSRSLAFDTVRLIARVHRVPAFISTFMEGKCPFYRVSFDLNSVDRTTAYIADGWLWCRVLCDASLRGEPVPVYDITVEDRHRFIANNVVVSNCQDISTAGKMAGNVKGSGTRSALAFEVPRILADTPPEDRPRYLVMEEVPNMISKKFLPNFQEMLDSLSELGYRHTYGILNAAEHGVAQSRRRCFCISKLDADPPSLPEPRPLVNDDGSPRCLKDFLEPEPVDERYYLSKERLEGLIWTGDAPGASGDGKGGSE